MPFLRVYRGAYADAMLRCCRAFADAIFFRHMLLLSLSFDAGAIALRVTPLPLMLLTPLIYDLHYAPRQLRLSP